MKFIQVLEEAEKSHRSTVDDLDRELRSVKLQYNDIKPKNEQLERDIRRALDDKAKIKVNSFESYLSKVNNGYK